MCWVPSHRRVMFATVIMFLYIKSKYVHTHEFTCNVGSAMTSSSSCVTSFFRLSASRSCSSFSSFMRPRNVVNEDGRHEICLVCNNCVVHVHVVHVMSCSCSYNRVHAHVDHYIAVYMDTVLNSPWPSMILWQKPNTSAAWCLKFLSLNSDVTSGSNVTRHNGPVSK